MSNTPLKKGRKHGSSDSINVTIETLLKYVPMTSAVPIRRKWLEQIEAIHGIKFVEPTKTVETVAQSVVITQESAEADETKLRPSLEIEEEQL